MSKCFGKDFTCRYADKSHQTLVDPSLLGRLLDAGVGNVIVALRHPVARMVSADCWKGAHNHHYIYQIEHQARREFAGTCRGCNVVVRLPSLVALDIDDL